MLQQLAEKALFKFKPFLDWSFLDKVFSFLSQDEVEKMKQEEGKRMFNS